MLLSLASCLRAAATDVLTQHNNNARTGVVTGETLLSPSALKREHFGKLFTLAVDGQIYAQPLVATGVEFPGKGRRNAVFVATMRNMVYAFDADGAAAAPLWKTYLGSSMPFDRIPKDAGAWLGQYNIRPDIGVTSTPVIDRDRGEMYLVAKIADPPCPGAEAASPACPVVYRIHALGLATGAVVRQMDIRIPIADSNIPAEDVARRHLQRPGLLLANHRIYAGFGGQQDAPPFHGWVIAFDQETLRQIEPAFCSTPGGEMGGIWQAGNGLAADDQGSLYLMTGNGSFDPEGHRHFSCAFVKLNPDLQPVDWFAPANVEALNVLDIDLGSSGPMLLPGTSQLAGAGKQGRLYLVNRSSLGHQQQRHWFHDGVNPPVQFFQVSRPWRVSWLSWFPLLFNVGYHHVHGGPVYWNSRRNGPTIYLWPEEDRVRAYRYQTSKGKFTTRPQKGMMGNKGMPGGFLSVSANGQEGGILWAAIPYQDDAWVEIVRGTLRAFDADTLELLWSTDRDEPADYFNFAKYNPPTVANGKVYLATFSDRLNVYGLHSPVPASAGRPAVKVSKDPRHRGHRKGASGHAGSHPH